MEVIVATVHDIAAYILEAKGPMSAVKLQKLVYYSQAWSLVWDGRPLFDESIEAWANGPVVRELYDRHRGNRQPSAWPEGDPDALDEEQQITLDTMLSFYGNEDAQWLSDLTHVEKPWKEARRGLADEEWRGHVISHASMVEYYAGH